MTVAEQRAKQGLPALGKKKDTPKPKGSISGNGGGSGTSSTIVEERRGETVVITKKDGVERRTYTPHTWRGTPITEISSTSKTARLGYGSKYDQTEFQKRIARDRLTRREQEERVRTGRDPFKVQPPRTPIFYGATYDPMGVSWVRTGISRTPEGTVGRFESKTLYPGVTHTYGTQTGVVVQTVKQPGPHTPAPPQMFPDTPVGRMYGKAVAIEEWEEKAGERAQKAKDIFKFQEFSPQFGGYGSFGGKAAAYALAVPALLTVGLGEQVLIAGAKASLFSEALIRSESRQSAKDELFGRAPKETAKEVGRGFDPTTPEGIVNIAVAGTMVFAIGSARAGARATTPKPGSIKQLGGKEYVKGGKTFRVQKGEFINVKGDPVRYDVRSTSSEYYVRLKTPGGKLISEGGGGLKQKSVITPRKDAFGQDLEGTFDFRTDTKYSQRGRLSKTERVTGEIRLGRERPTKGRMRFEEVQEFVITRGGKQVRGIEVSDVTRQGKVTQFDFKTSRQAKVGKPSVRGRLANFGKRGELFSGREAFDSGFDVGMPADFGTLIKPSLEGGFGRPSTRFSTLPEELFGGRVGGKPGLVVDSQARTKVISKGATRSSSIARSISMSKPESIFSAKGLSLVDAGFTGRSISEAFGKSGVESGIGGGVDTDFGLGGGTSGGRTPSPPPPLPPLPPGIGGLLLPFPGLGGEMAGGRKRGGTSKRGFGYTPSFALSASHSLLGTKIIKTPKLRRKKKFTGLELRGI